jgi:hypothetical protein
LGFSIADDGLVSINHHINHYAITAANIGKSPCSVQTKCVQPMTIHSVYYRPKNSKSSRLKGDNCPFIYAWKKKVPDLYITKYSLFGMREEFYVLLDQMVNNILDYNKIDFIVPMPSKHCLANNLARRVSRLIPNAQVFESLFEKKTNDKMIEQIEYSNLNGLDKSRLMYVINRATESKTSFSISDVPTYLREYLDPVEMTQRIVPEGTYLLVDDLFATGSTIINAKEKIIKNSNKSKVLGAVLFSPHLNKINKRF